MNPRQPVTTRRAATVTAAAFAGCAIAAMGIGPAHPAESLGACLAVCAAAAVALPAPGAVWAARLAGRLIPRRVTRSARFAVSAIVGQPYGDRPQGRVRARLREWHERAYFHLSRAEWAARVSLGMSLWHWERVAISDVPPGLRRLEEWLWPGLEWTRIVEDVWREQERRRRQ